jgi:hypothetical protein
VRCPTELPRRPSPVALRATRRGGGVVGHSEGTSSESRTDSTRFDSDVRLRAKLSSPPVETALAVETLHLHLQSAFTRLRLVGCQTQPDNVVEAGSTIPALSERVSASRAGEFTRLHHIFGLFIIYNGSDCGVLLTGTMIHTTRAGFSYRYIVELIPMLWRYETDIAGIHVYRESSQSGLGLSGDMTPRQFTII